MTRSAISPGWSAQSDSATLPRSCRWSPRSALPPGTGCSAGPAPHSCIPSSTQHVPGRSTRHHRPHPRLLHRRHRRSVLHAHSRFPRRPAAPATVRHPRERIVDRKLDRNAAMNNLYRDLAPVTDLAWAPIEPPGRRRDHLGSCHRRCICVVHARRRFRSEPAHRRVDRIPVPRLPERAAVSGGDHDVPVLHRRGIAGADAIGQPRSRSAMAVRGNSVGFG